MRTWSDSPFPRTVQLRDVEGHDASAVIARDNGESSVIHEAPGNPGWLVKRYKPSARVGHIALDDLIELPGGMARSDLALVDRSVAWPVSRVVDGYRTVGTIMARAHDDFSWDVALLQGRTRRQTIELDLLANPDRDIERLGLPVPTPELRLATMRELVAVAALFERQGLVYGDWSFANAFWAPGTDRVLVIDMDTARMGTRDHLESHNWDDPLADKSRPLTTYTDRYKVALLVARTTTGLRQERLKAVEGMAALYPAYSDLTDLLAKCIGAPTLEARPRLEEILAAMERPSAARSRIASDRLGCSAPAGANVTGMIPWRPAGRRTPHRPRSRARTAPTTRQTVPAASRPDIPTSLLNGSPSGSTSQADLRRGGQPDRTGTGCSPAWIITVLLIITLLIVIALRS